MHRLVRFLGEMCEKCPLCRHARKNPDTLVGKIMAWHGRWCPAWKAHQQVERARRERPS